MSREVERLAPPHFKKEGDIIEVRKESPQERYDRKNRVVIALNLNKKTDADILAAVEGKAKQTELKRLIRIGLTQGQ